MREDAGRAPGDLAAVFGFIKVAACGLDLCNDILGHALKDLREIVKIMTQMNLT
jgi:hypothetical protein